MQGFLFCASCFLRFTWYSMSELHKGEMYAMRISKRRYSKSYPKNVLPLLQEDERIYLNVPFAAKDFAHACSCGFDTNKKLWFTGVCNLFLKELVEMYGINIATTEKALRMLEEKSQ